nr:phospholipase D-like domain-containing protein [Limobrevibacterium gyesilva]
MIAAATVQLVFAAGVTIHVLLTKRNVASSTTWIGLAWLSPLAGALLYLLFGINRVSRRARRLRRRPLGVPAAGGARAAVPGAPNLAALDIAAGRITGRPALAGNAIAALSQGDEAYPAMLQAIGAAQASVALSSYIFRDDTTGGHFIAALTDAARRGVQVRVLIDGIGGGYIRSGAYRRLRADGVPAARFLHSLLPWRMPFLNLRTHKKLLIVDGRRAFTGGLNIGDENVMATQPPHPVRDTHFSVTGPVVADLMTAFSEDWQFTTGERLTGTAWFPPIDHSGDSIARAITSGPDHDLEKIKGVMLAAIASARHSVRIATPYFLPDAPLTSALALAALRDVAVDIVIPARSDHRIMDWSARPGLRPLLEAGCRIWHGAAPFDHSKLMTVDGAWSLVGSANWDMRSLRLNFEIAVETYDPALAVRLDQRIASRHGRRLSLGDIDARPLPAALRDAAFRLLLPYL